MNELQATARFRIHSGEIEEFKDQAAQCMATVRTRDTGILQYDWFLNAAGTECVVRKWWRDSAEVLEHVANLGDLTGRFLAITTPDVEITGAPTDELLQAVAALRPRAYPALHSM